MKAPALRIVAMAIITASVAGPVGHVAFGQGEGADNQLHAFDFLENLSMVIMPDGHAVRRHIADPGTAETILKDARPMKKATILMMHDGRIYMVRDEQSAGGQMLSAMIMRPAR
jgi:hypothetical protein